MKKFKNIVLVMLAAAIMFSMSSAASASQTCEVLLSSKMLVFPAGIGVENNYNAAKAADYINGTVVNPGDSFSFNDIVGERTFDRGFIIGLNTVNVPDLGGGVCRTSTILFQVVRSLGLDITERWPHTPPVSYTDSDSDAAVQWGVCDLKFYNNKDIPLLFRTGMDVDSLGCSRLWAGAWGVTSGSPITVTVSQNQKSKMSTTEKVSIIKNVSTTEYGILLNGKTYLPISKLTKLYNVDTVLKVHDGAFDLESGSFLFSETDSSLIRSGREFYVPVRKWVELYGGNVAWVDKPIAAVVLNLPEFKQVAVNEGSFLY